MSNLSRYVALPTLAPLVIIGLYFTPVELIGCVNRGLLAVAIVLVALVAGTWLGIRAIIDRRAGRTDSAWKVLAAAILAIPALLVLGPLG